MVAELHAAPPLMSALLPATLLLARLCLGLRAHSHAASAPSHAWSVITG